MNTWLPRDATRKTYSWAMLMKDVDLAGDHAFFNWIGGTSGARADAAIYVFQGGTSTNLRFQHFAGNTNMISVQNITFNPGSTNYVWICNWLDGTNFHGGWVESSTSESSPESSESSSSSSSESSSESSESSSESSSDPKYLLEPLPPITWPFGAPPNKLLGSPGADFEQQGDTGSVLEPPGAPLTKPPPTPCGSGRVES